MILIADGGSTRTTWCLIGKEENTIFETEGYHPFFVDSDYIGTSLKKSIPEKIKTKAGEVSEVLLYSAGGGYSKEADNILIRGIKSMFSKATITIETDLLAAARGLLGKQKGFASILGTGTNTCIYDGNKVTPNIESLGFILGDEGSGAYIGKKVVGDFIRGYMPREVADRFHAHIKMSTEELINHIYTAPMVNRFCAGFCEFVGQNMSTHDYYRKVVHDAFQDFFRNIVIGYSDYDKYTFNGVGSVAYYFKDILAEVAASHGMGMGTIYRSPITGLIIYHSN